MKNRYLNTIAYIDSLLDIFIQFLEQQNQLDKSIIVITGDHGEEFWEHGHVAHSRYLDEEAIRVPLILWGAKGYRARWAAMSPVTHVDIAPTIYHLLDLPITLSFQGSRIVSRATEAHSEEVRENPVFVSSQALIHEDAVILWPWKLVRNLWGEGTRMFRLDKDPHESKNRFNLKDPNALMLCGCLIKFRASQLYYYNPLNELETKFYPPQYHTCKGVDGSTIDIAKFCNFR